MLAVAMLTATGASPSALAEANAKIKALEQKLAQRDRDLDTALKQKASPSFAPAAAAAPALDDRIFDESAMSSPSSSSKYVPHVSPSNCYGTKPCLHTSASERLAMGCLESIWEGTFGGHVTYIHEKIPNTNIEYDRTVAPIHTSIERFVPKAGGVDKCDLSDVFQLSKYNPDKHVKDAVEQHFHRRLKGLKNSVWLLSGSSIDHDFLKESCLAYGMQRTTLGPYFGTAFPAPQGMMVDFCWLQPLNLTLTDH